MEIGPDGRRLYAAGDFNIEIDKDALLEGTNTIVIQAINPSGLQSSYTVTIDFSRSNVWYLPYTIDWSKVANLQDVVQVVDGKWRITSIGIHTDQVGYDRILAIGDMAWDSFEILVPVTIHWIDPIAWTLPNSTAPGLGIIIRWLGHTNNPVNCLQPHCGWEPEGGSSWYEWRQGTDNILRLNASPSSNPPSSTTSIQFVDGHTYWFRVRVEAVLNGSLYSMKVWEGTREPGSWTRQRQATLENLAHGSLLLVAHHVNATFGNITITSLNPSTYPLSVKTVGNGSVAKSPDQTVYSKFQKVTLTVTPGLGWEFSHWSGGISGALNPVDFTVTGNQVVTATYSPVEYPLTLGISGSGTVTKAPDRPTYHYGDAVTLAATGNPGWAFTGWSGDLAGTEPQKTTIITQETSITATFSPIEYTLSVSAQGAGEVKVNPDQPTYHYGQRVTLTAQANLNWWFGHWSGDFTGGDNPLTITITQNIQIDAIFVPNRVLLPIIKAQRSGSSNEASEGERPPPKPNQEEYPIYTWEGRMSDRDRNHYAAFTSRSTR